jgi:hypothetical protein
MSLGGCKQPGPEGIYELDKEATESGLKRGFPTEAWYVKSDEAAITISSGGTYERVITFPGLTATGRGQLKQTETGKWTVDGDSLELVAAPHRVSCKVRSDALECKSDAFMEPITKGFTSVIYFKKRVEAR